MDSGMTGAAPGEAISTSVPESYGKSPFKHELMNSPSSWPGLKLSNHLKVKTEMFNYF